MRTLVETVVKHITSLTPDVKRFDLGDPGDWILPPFKPGAHIDLRLPNGLTRSYSICSDHTHQQTWSVAVKRESGGRGGSLFMHSDVRVGDTIGVSLPRNHLPMCDEATRHVFVAGGIGITPFLPMMAALVRLKRPFELHFSAKTRAQMPFLDEAVRYRDLGYAKLYFTSESGARPDVSGIIQRELADPGTHLYACGPESLIDAFSQLGDGGGGRVHFERFSAPRSLAAAAASEHDFELRLRQSGRTLRVPPGRSILSIVRDDGLSLDGSCEAGICRGCRTRIVDGAVDHRDFALSKAEQKDWMLVCVSRAAGETLEIDL